MPERPPSRGLSAGAGACLIVAILCAVGAAYFLLSPVQVASTQGPLDCGSAIQPPQDDFAAGFCLNATNTARSRAIASGAAALAVSLGGFWTFGLRRRESG